MQGAQAHPLAANKWIHLATILPLRDHIPILDLITLCIQLTYDNGDVVSGVWANGVLNGHGTLKYENGDFYEGTP